MQKRKLSHLSLKKISWQWLVAGLPYCLPLMIYYFHYWLKRYFDMPSLAQVMNHLAFGVDGIEAANYVYLTFIYFVVLIPLVIALLLALLVKVVRIVGSGFILPIVLQLVLNTKAKKNLPNILNIFGKVFFYLKWLAIIFFIVSNTMNLSVDMKLKDFLQGEQVFQTANNPDYFARHYIDPKNVIITPPDNKKNLVIIILESFEDNFRQPDFFGRNLIPHLLPFENKGMQLTFHQVPPNSYTISAHVSLECGLPLKSILFGKNNSNVNKQQKQIKHILHNATCLSDILKTHGYYNVFMKGATFKTGGMGNFYNSHQFDETYYLEDWNLRGYALTPHKKGQWGLYDEYIFEETYKKLLWLQKHKKNTQQPFLLMVATLDLHPLADSTCTVDAKDKTLDKVVECTSASLANFLTKADHHNLFANSNVVIIGDHLLFGMKGIKMVEWNAVYPVRHIYNLFLQKNLEPMRYDITHYDLFPSLLEHLGFKIQGGRLGLGYSVFQKHPSYPNLDEWHKIIGESLQYSKTYLNLWTRPVAR
ncbi:MAG: LTA synthase family protein [Alphaproteobacteria bacterium]